MDIKDLSANNIPPVGFGPGINKKLKYKHKPQGVWYFLFRVFNKVVYESWTSFGYVSSVKSALQAGFRLIDYSSAYGNGKLIGRGIRKSGVPRESLFITTRVSNRAQERHTVREEFFKCLKGMGIEYVDLLQFHWPVTGLYLDTWREMEKLYEELQISKYQLATVNYRMNAIPAPFVALKSLNENDITFVVRAWVRGADYWNVFFDLQERFYTELPPQGFTFAYPHMDVTMLKD